MFSKIIFILYLLVQLYLPLRALVYSLDGAPARFGWQMYSLPAPISKTMLVSRSDGAREVDLTQHFIALREDFDYRTLAFERFCADPDISGLQFIELSGRTEFRSCD